MRGGGTKLSAMDFGNLIRGQKFRKEDSVWYSNIPPRIFRCMCGADPISGAAAATEATGHSDKAALRPLRAG